KMIAELQAERDRLDEAILALERLSTSNAKRRGRPPRWLKDAQDLEAHHPPDSDRSAEPQHPSRGGASA
ncbi:MAG TPA: hypothetical protein VHZ55_34835, partial [Bryobacteraceae bacterium]|nr:hypothetical protein [Bryobacteraceae bacterium]